jgi:hypothetical protein
MPSSGMSRRVAIVRTGVSEDTNTSIISVSSSPILLTLMEALSSSETWVLIRETLHNIPEDAILHNPRR